MGDSPISTPLNRSRKHAKLSRPSLEHSAALSCGELTIFVCFFFRRGDRDADSSLTDPGIRLVHCYGKFLLNVSRRRLIQKIQDLSKLLVGQISELAIGLRRRDECHPMNDRGRFGQMT